MQRKQRVVLSDKTKNIITFSFCYFLELEYFQLDRKFGLSAEYIVIAKIITMLLSVNVTYVILFTRFR